MRNNDPTQNIDKFLGIRNKEQSRRLPAGSLLVAENVDIDNMGGVVMRNGYALSALKNNISAAFSTQDERRAFIVDDGDLLLVNKNLTTELLLTGFTSDYIHWLEVADFILMSTGHIISKDNTVSLWRIPNPHPPVISSVGGHLLEGQYQIVITYVDASGREGGASDVAIFNVTEGSGFTFTPDYNGYTVRAYVSDVNGEILYLQGEYSAGGITVTKTSSLTYPIDEAQLKSYPVPDRIQQLAFYESKVFASQFDNGQSVIFFSQPFWWNLFDLSNDHLIVPGNVNMLLGTSNGLIIGTDDEIYIYTNESTLVQVADYGVPDGKPYTKDDNGNIFIHSKQGLCSLFPFKNLTEDKVSLPPGEVCFVEQIEHNGFKKVVVLTDGNGLADNAL